MNQPQKLLRIAEIDDEGWAAFKKMEGEQRQEYAQSHEAILDHNAWVNSPMAEDDEWESVPTDEWVEPQIVPNPHGIPWELLYDWSLERTKDDDRENP